MLIEEAKIPDHYSNTFVEYSLKTTEFKTETFQTQVCTEKTQNPKYNYKITHAYPEINQGLLEYLMTAKVESFIFR